MSGIKASELAYWKSIAAIMKDAIPYTQFLQLSECGAKWLMNNGVTSGDMEEMKAYYDEHVEILSYDEWLETDTEETRDLSLYSGTYKWVFVHPDCDYVMKFQYDLQDAVTRELSIDNFEDENAVYAAAVEEGFGEYFLENIEIAEGFYLQKKVDRMVEDISEEEGEEYGIPHCGYNMDETRDYLCEIPHFKKFLNKFSVGDLHAENVGYIGDQIVIFDCFSNID